MPESPYFSSYRGGDNSPPPGYGALLALPGQYISQGIGEAGDAVESAIKRGKLSKSMGATIDSYADMLPEDQATALKAQNASWGISDRSGFIQSLSLKNAMADAQARQQDVAAQAQLRQQQATDDQVSGSLLSGAMADDSFKTDPVGALQRSAKAAAASGVPTAALSRSFPRALDSLVKLQGVMADGANTKLNPTYTEDPVTGARALLYGKDAISTGNNPEKQYNATMPVLDASNNLLGYNVPKGGKAGGYSFVKADQLTAVDKQKLMLEHQKVIKELSAQALVAKDQPNLLSAINDQIGEHQAAIGSLKSTGAPAAAAAGAAPKPTPQDIQYLRANPTSAMAAKFNGRFGNGAADQYLP